MQKIKSVKRENSKKAKLKGHSGITLIALIITIIVLLILAGVALATLTGDSGILSNADKAKEETLLANSKEQVALAVTSAMTYTDSLGKVTKANLVTELNRLIGEGKYTITPDDEIGPWTVKVKDTGYTTTISGTGSMQEVIKVKEITIVEESLELEEEEERELTVTITPSNSNEGIAYKSSNTAIATVDSTGKVTAVAEGTVTITVAGKVSTTIKDIIEVTVTEKVIPSKLTEEEKAALTTNGIEELTGNSITNANLKKNPNIKAVLTGQVPIPTQFSYVEGTKETGVVVSVAGANNVISEFVWVPVETPVASAEADGTTNKAMAINLGTEEAPQYRGLFYEFTGTTTVTSEVESGCTTTTTDGYREPSLVTGSNGTSYDGAKANYNTLLGYDSAKEFGEQMQKDYDLMIQSVIKYGGFYIGRYETSVNGETVASTTGTTDTRPMASVQWYELYTKQKAFSTNNSLTAIQSSMVWGSQYDAMLNWAINGADSTKVTAKSNASHALRKRYQPGKQTATGKKDKINNIYDLEGNVKEWTLAAVNDQRYARGGMYNQEAPPWGGWPSQEPTVSVANYGSRVTFYIL